MTNTYMITDVDRDVLANVIKHGLEQYKDVTDANVFEALGYFQQNAKDTLALLEKARPTKTENYYQEA